MYSFSNFFYDNNSYNTKIAKLDLAQYFFYKIFLNTLSGITFFFNIGNYNFTSLVFEFADIFDF